jgi:DNA repair protein RadD
MAWGKGVLIALLAVTFARRGWRVLILAHRRELLEQNHGVLRRLDPIVDAGICSASLAHDNTGARIVVGGTAISDASSSMLARIREALGDPPLVGLTATPFRGDGISLIDSGVFEAIVHEVTITDALKAGLLCPLVTKSPRVGQIDMRGVRVTAGEFNARDMERAAMTGDTTRLAIARTVEVARAEDRKCWLIFAAGVAHAQQIGAELERHGVAYAVIVGTTDSDERSEAIARFRAGEITAIVNCNVLTEGFDATRIDLVAFLRATTSPVLWVQAPGRGMRLHPGKETCRLLDFGGNLARHGPLDSIRLRKPGERHDADRAAGRSRVCPACDEANAAGALVCAACGEELVRRSAPVGEPVLRDHDSKLDAREGELAALGGGAGQWVEVHGAAARVHAKPGGSPCLRLRYDTTVGSVTEFLAFDSSPGARWHARRRWNELSRVGWRGAPSSTSEALGRVSELRRPARLLVQHEGGWLRIRQTQFETEAVA